MKIFMLRCWPSSEHDARGCRSAGSMPCSAAGGERRRPAVWSRSGEQGWRRPRRHHPLSSSGWPQTPTWPRRRRAAELGSAEPWRTRSPCRRGSSRTAAAPPRGAARRTASCSGSSRARASLRCSRRAAHPPAGSPARCCRNANVAELMRLADFVPRVFYLEGPDAALYARILCAHPPALHTGLPGRRRAR